MTTSPVLPSSHVSDSGGGSKKSDTPVVSLTQPDLLEKSPAELSVSEEAVVKALEKAQKMLDGVPRKFDYEVYHHRVVVKVINSETNEVIREIPPKKFVDLVDNLMELSGMIIDEKR